MGAIEDDRSPHGTIIFEGGRIVESGPVRSVLMSPRSDFAARIAKQEAAEAIGVSILMHDGPVTIYGARAYTAFCEFADTAIAHSA
jgi:hypothetical protein